MKRILIILTIIITLFCLFTLGACAKKEETPVDPVKHTVTVIIENPIENIKKTYEVEDGSVIAPLLNDKQKGYSYYTSRTGTIEWNIYKDEVTCDMTLYVKAS